MINMEIKRHLQPLSWVGFIYKQAGLAAASSQQPLAQERQGEDFGEIGWQRAAGAASCISKVTVGRKHRQKARPQGFRYRSRRGKSNS